MTYDMMPAGHELDTLIAVKVMGLHKELEEGFGPGMFDVWRTAKGYKCSQHGPPPYSTSIEAAWTLTERLKEHESQNGLFRLEYDKVNKTWWAGFPLFSPPQRTDTGFPSSRAFAVAETAPLAISRVALMVSEK